VVCILLRSDSWVSFLYLGHSISDYIFVLFTLKVSKVFEGRKRRIHSNIFLGASGLNRAKANLWKINDTFYFNLDNNKKKEVESASVVIIVA
jgi:hypothetical protein